MGPNAGGRIVATFSIVAYDPETGGFGVAVQSKFLAVGAAVPWAKAGVGAVATQALANLSYGPKGLELMAGGKSARETVEALTAGDEGRADRQVGVVDATGAAATYTGEDCFDWAGGVTGDHYAAQGNILVGRETVEAMARTYEERTAAGGISFAKRLIVALDAGQEAGGDSRGRQSAAVLVVAEGGGYGGDERTVDLRVDDHPDPIKELMRLYELHELYFGEAKPEDVVPIEGEVRGEVVASLRRFGYLEADDPGDDALFGALRAWTRTENFEGREQGRGYLDRAVLRFMKGKAGT
ncbi:MAG: DUF1028 domain-containing protein [Actinomycetota bacterium]|nr:DUF1028 domain-containing protein [Actinomycetota bacterium]